MRAAVLGNGRLSLGWDPDLRLREMFWPTVGLLNHIQEKRDNRLVFWHSGRFDCLGGDRWETAGRYGPGMSFRWDLSSTGLGLTACVTDCVDPYLPVWARCVDVFAADGGPLGGDSALYSVQAYALGENTIGEEAAWDPEKRRLYHFKGTFWVAIQMGVDPLSPGGRAEKAVVAKVRDGGVRFVEGTGEAEGPAVDHGLIESAVGVRWEDGSRAHADYMVSFGRDRSEADRNLDAAGDPESVLNRSERHWAGIPEQDHVSVAVLVSHSDRGGGIIAATDTDIQGDYRDHYRYVWPRDAAMCASSLLRAGLPAYAERYLGFCQRAVADGGFLWQRYRADGSRGSGWHPWPSEGGDLPIQEDETALSLITAGDYLDLARDLEGLNEVYPGFIKKAAEFTMDYTQEAGTLVRPSYDLWEERRGVFAFTQAACAGGLFAASRVASALGRDADRDRFEAGAASLLSGLVRRLSSDATGFGRGLDDQTDDASLFLVPLVLPRDGARFQNAAAKALLEVALDRSMATWARLRKSLAVTLPGAAVPGFARYAGDWYWRPANAGGLPGNPWPLTTAWYVLAGLRLGVLGHDDLDDYLDWFARVAGDGGTLPEQLDCVTGEHRSVSPLAWSHALHLELSSQKRAEIDRQAPGKNSHHTPGGETNA